MSTYNATSISVGSRSETGVLARAARLAFAAGVFMLGIGVNAWAFTDPSDVAGLVLWLDGDDLDGDGTAEGAGEDGLNAGNIQTWVDKSVSSTDLTQATGGLQPLYALAALNGRAIARFDGADDFLLNAAISQAQPSTLIIVWQLQEDVSASTATLTDSDSAVTSNSIYANNNTLNAWGGANLGYAITSPFANAIVSAVYFAGGSGALFEDGASQASGAIGADALDGFRIGTNQGGTTPIQADVAEVILYNRALTGPELGAVNKYLGGKWGVTISNTAPVVTAGGTLAYTENAVAEVIDAGVTVTDADDLDLDGATVSITTGFDTGDVLAATDQLGVTSAYVAGTGVLTLIGVAPVADYQIVLRTVTFTSTNDDPTTPKTVTYEVDDGEDTHSDTATINVTAENDAPTVTAGGTLNYTEGDPAAVIDAAVTVTDPDDTNIEGGTVSITAGFDTGDVLAADTSGTAIATAYDGGTGVLTLSNQDTVANYQQVLRTVTFTSTSEDPAASKTVTYEVDDGDVTDSDTATINVTAENDAPTVTAGGTLAYAEGGPAAVIDNGVTLDDPDDTNIESGTVSITAGFNDGDMLAADTGGTSVTADYNADTGVLTLSGADTLANYQQVLRGVEFSSTSDDPAASKTVTYLVNDGDDDGSDTATINVTVDNDAPTLAINAGLTVGQGETATIDDFLLGVTDVDNTPAEITFTVEAVPANGELQLDGATLAATDTLTQADIDNSLLTYVHDNSATTADSFEFSVADGAGGTIGATTFAITIEPAAATEPELQITVESASGTASPGDDVAFAVTIENSGNGDATDVVVVVPLPADTELVSVDIGAKQAAQDLPVGVTVADGIITIEIGGLAAGQKVTIDIVLRATAAGSIVLSASVTSEETPDAVAADAPATVAVEDAYDQIITTHEPVRLCGAAGLFPWLMLCTLVGVKARATRRRSNRDHSASSTSTDS